MALGGIEEGYGAKSQHAPSVERSLGIDVARAASGTVPCMGGPFVAAKPPSAHDVFDRQLYRINLARREVDLMKRTVVALPLRKPLAGEPVVTSFRDPARSIPGPPGHAHRRGFSW